ncbi:MAG: lysylphosphatidylglycerol synthase transmembrane domain-containing protein [Terracidiphilus sp.]
MKKSQWILGLIVLAALAGLFAYEQHLHPFNWHVFIDEFRKARWTKVGIGAGLIYLAFILRAVRWEWLLRPNKRVPLLSLLGTQVMGFTAVALIGRIADLVRPYLIAKKTGLPITSQIAVYIVERLFDGGSMALLFSTAILVSPPGTLPHQEIFNRFGKGGLIATLAGALFLVAVRLSGRAVAAFCEKILAPLSHKLAQSAGDKIRKFHAGLDTLRTPADFAVTLSVSLVMWGMITMAYVEGVGAFVPESQGSLLAKCLALMAGGGIASIIQLPVIGWFTQIAALEVMLRPLFGMTPETAIACATTLLLITFLGIAPVGLIWAQFEHINLRKVTLESEHVEEEISSAQDSDPAVVP